MNCSTSRANRNCWFRWFQPNSLIQSWNLTAAQWFNVFPTKVKQHGGPRRSRETRNHIKNLKTSTFLPCNKCCHGYNMLWLHTMRQVSRTSTSALYAVVAFPLCSAATSPPKNQFSCTTFALRPAAASRPIKLLPARHSGLYKVRSAGKKRSLKLNNGILANSLTCSCQDRSNVPLCFFNFQNRGLMFLIGVFLSCSPLLMNWLVAAV